MVSLRFSCFLFFQSRRLAHRPRDISRRNQSGGHHPLLRIGGFEHQPSLLNACALKAGIHLGVDKGVIRCWGSVEGATEKDKAVYLSTFRLRVICCLNLLLINHLVSAYEFSTE